MASETSLYKINDSITKVRKIFENMDNPVDQKALVDTLDSLKDAQSAKIDSLASWTDSLSAQDDWIEKRIKQLTELKRRNAHLEDWINGYIVDSMKASNYKKMQTENHLITTRNSKKVIVDDEKLLPDEFVKTTTTTKPDKKALRKALMAEDAKDGGKISGAHLEQNTKAVIK